jgi:molybdate transport repressor ModE-like protein
MKIDLDALETLQAIAEEGSFSAAARRLHITQSSVSYAIRRLEERLDIAVFDRSGHRARLTEAGRMLLEEGREVLAGARRLESLAAHVSTGWEPTLAVIIDGILPMNPVMAALRTMADTQVPTSIEVKMEFLGGVAHRFEADRADLMLVKDFELGSHLNAHALSAVTVALVAAPEHPLTNAEQTLTLRDLRDHIELTIQDSSADAQRDERMFGGARMFYLSDFHTKRHAILEGLGFGWMPLHLVQDDLDAGKLVELDYAEGSRYDFKPQLVHRAEQPLGKAGQLFLERLREEFDVLGE